MEVGGEGDCIPITTLGDCIPIATLSPQELFLH